MNLLLDTQILIWSAADTLPPAASRYILDESNHLFFSAASIWETVIKKGLGRTDFEIDPHLLYRGLLENGYQQISVSAQHTLLVGTLPVIHKDPFDRILLAQAVAESIPLLTADGILAEYPVPVILIKNADR